MLCTNLLIAYPFSSFISTEGKAPCCMISFCYHISVNISIFCYWSDQHHLPFFVIKKKSSLRLHTNHKYTWMIGKQTHFIYAKPSTCHKPCSLLGKKSFKFLNPMQHQKVPSLLWCHSWCLKVMTASSKHKTDWSYDNVYWNLVRPIC